MSEHFEKTPLIITGAGGRMGKALLRALGEHETLSLAASWENPQSPLLGKDCGETAGLENMGIAIGKTGEMPDLPATPRPVLVDFSHGSALDGLCALVEENQWALVCGTTGLEEAQKARLAAAAGKVPVLYSGNMSLGIALLAELTRRAASILGEGWDIELLELHHREKLDAPSGTALLLAEAAKAGRGGGQLTKAARSGKREKGAIGYAVLRGGTAAGEHEVLFAGPQERLRLAHSAEDRSIFAHGALKAAAWLAGQPKGFFTLADMIKF